MGGSYLETKMFEAAQATRYPPEAEHNQNQEFFFKHKLKILMVNDMDSPWLMVIVDPMITCVVLSKGHHGHSTGVAPEQHSLDSA